MTTTESPMIARLWDRIQEVEPHALRGKILNGGSVGDASHQAEGHTYHESWDDQAHDGGYSVHYYGDAHPGHAVREYASALDVTMHDPDLMARYTGRLAQWCRETSGAHVLIGLREFAGTLNGRDVFAMDTHTKGRPYRTFGWDDSHLWHIHLSINRRLVNNPRILRIADVWAGK